jgi:recombination protein RecT
MSDQTAITPYNRFQRLVVSDNVQQRFKDLLGKRTAGFMSSLLSVVAGSNALQNADPATIFTAAAKAAILQLPIEPALGFAYIVPFKGNATFIIGYKGLIQLAIRSAQYLAINAALVYEGERVLEDRLTGNVKLNGQRTGDAVIGYVAYFKLRNGFEKYVYMSRLDIEVHAKRYSKSYGDPKSAWTTNFDDMGKKTVLRLLLGKYGLLSIEMQDEDDASLPVVGADPDDPRFQTPDLSVPGFDDVIEGETKPDVLDQIVELHLSENRHAAEKALQKANPSYDTDDKKVAWMRVYRGWRDAGSNSNDAAKAANSGQMPM